MPLFSLERTIFPAELLVKPALGSRGTVKHWHTFLSFMFFDYSRLIKLKDCQCTTHPFVFVLLIIILCFECLQKTPQWCGECFLLCTAHAGIQWSVLDSDSRDMLFISRPGTLGLWQNVVNQVLLIENNKLRRVSRKTLFAFKKLTDIVWF